MNTKTMRLPPRRVLSTDKRVLSAVKQSETAVTRPPPPPNIPPVKSILKKTRTAAPPPTTTASSAVAAVNVAEPTCSNQLLAGYLAYEFLNKGTLFGEQWNPARAQAGPFTAQLAESRKSKPSYNAEPSDRKRRRYEEVANLLRADGSHLPGIVNPSQLARSLKL